MTGLETTTIATAPPVSLEQRRDTLYARLDAGFDKIERAARDGKDVSRWEQGWYRLLREYQDVCDQIAARETASVGAA